MTRPDRAVLRSAGLAASTLVLAWPQLGVAAGGAFAMYSLVIVVFTALMATITVTWPRGGAADGSITWRSPTPAIVAAVAAALLLAALYRWTQILVWQPYGADMLIVIREATRRLLAGRMPYTTYRTYDAPWDIAMPYGPALWLPFLGPQLLRLDFRVVTIVGELFVPVWCGVAAVVESARGRIAGAAAWLAVLAAFVLALDVQGFTRIGHTPVYWPLLPLFAVTMQRARWTQAACLLGVLIAARTTMVAIVPIFLIAAWTADRRRIAFAILALAATVLAALAPFLVWDYRAVWASMVLSYPRVMTEAVWPVLARPGLETIGVTEWLIERQRTALVMPVQVVTMIAVYVVGWRAIRRGAPAAPWMALALFAFSMTTLYPVHYLYYDVLLLLISIALAEVLPAGRVRMTATAWLTSLIALTVVTVVATQASMPAFPRIVVGEPGAREALRAGFSTVERDGGRRFSWIVGQDATIVLPRRSAAPAAIVLTVQSPFGDGDAPQTVSAMLNGNLLGHVTVPTEWAEIRFAAPRSTWWIGYNQLQLRFSATVSPSDAGAGSDTRRLALALGRVDVTPSGK